MHILALGVFFTGWIKDLVSLPRPLSPPLNRITMSGSAALEYGFPSTHSANAVSVVVYGIYMLHSPDNTLPPTTKLFLELLSYSYALSIVIGRLYCGMHGFVDVVAGSSFGALLSVIEFKYGPSLDEFMHTSSWLAPMTSTIIIMLLVGFHPEPADDCPCFDDSVAFAGVVVGLEIGTWMYGRLPWNAFTVHAYGDNDLPSLGIPLQVVRVILGVFIIFAWREIMKPAMLRGLPHLFRLMERANMNLPRRFFKPASQYKTVPENSRMDTLIPSVSDIPRVVESIRHPRTRGRSISIGPQSAADAYEALAYRERRRRESVGSNSSLKETQDQDGTCAASGVQDSSMPEVGSSTGHAKAPGGESEMDILVEKQDALEEKQMFEGLIKSRTRYDVEVVTKMVVYTGKSRYPGLQHLRNPAVYTKTTSRHRVVRYFPHPYDFRGRRPRL